MRPPRAARRCAPEKFGFVARAAYERARRPGNAAEAMRVYDLARTTLDQELGITPGRAILEAHARLLGTPAAAS
jgi:hypothetical protein